MKIKNTNLVIVSGYITERPAETKPGSGYYRTKLEIRDEEYGKHQLIEIMGKFGDWMDDSDVGDLLIVTATLSGRANDKGFINMSLWSRSVEVVTMGHSVPAGGDDEDMPY